MSFSNQAAWLDGKGKQLRIGPADMPSAGDGEIVIRNRAIAVNPVSCKIQDTGFLVQTWPAILDYDIAGEVHQVGPKVDKFKRGDRVIAMVSSLFGAGARSGAYQRYSVAEIVRAARIPDRISFTEASVLPTCFSTGIVALCAGPGKGFGLPVPSLNPAPSGKTIVVWGASSSVGLQTLQLARAAGINTIATASPHNFEVVKAAGASKALDYRAKSIVDGLVAAVGDADGDFVGIIDCISEEEQSLNHCVAVLQRLGGGKLGVVKPSLKIDLPDNVELSRIFGLSDLTDPFWKDFLTPALENGTLKCLPEPRVVGEGLELLQPALDTLRNGVSATKLVVML